MYLCCICIVLYPLLTNLSFQRCNFCRVNDPWNLVSLLKKYGFENITISQLDHTCSAMWISIGPCNINALTLIEAILWHHDHNISYYMHVCTLGLVQMTLWLRYCKAVDPEMTLEIWFHFSRNMASKTSQSLNKIRQNQHCQLAQAVPPFSARKNTLKICLKNDFFFPGEKHFFWRFFLIFVCLVGRGTPLFF